MMRSHHFTDCRYKQLFLALSTKPHEATKSKNLSNSVTSVSMSTATSTRSSIHITRE
ncbi:hypothetical protein PHMEG_00015535 [Phytophthora megakarya]|uniref:Uncharacterized protein n=1 Tax=Phytophthora megakarya TaxID=4795 RepID=A0A225W168_9STRA|nr:hypothetical protein PHMEG_00015535 [Phytophthora megakarya]